MSATAQYPNLVGGEWRPSSAGGWFAVRDPADRRRLVGEVPAMTPGDHARARPPGGLSQHPAVAESTVIGVPDEHWGEAVKALVVAAPGTTPTADDLIGFARTRLAGYKLPRSEDFVSELPRTPTGKVLKRELRARHLPSLDRGMT